MFGGTNFMRLITAPIVIVVMLVGALAALGATDTAQFVLRNGSRAMTGDLNMGGNDITNAATVTATTSVTSAALNLSGTLTFDSAAAGTLHKTLSIEDGGGNERFKWEREATTGHYTLKAYDDTVPGFKAILQIKNDAQPSWVNRTGVPHFWEKVFLQGRTNATEFLEFRATNTYPTTDGAGTGRGGFAVRDNATDANGDRVIWWAENNYGIHLVTATASTDDFGSLGVSRLRIPATTGTDHVADIKVNFARLMFDGSTHDLTTLEPHVGIEETDSLMRLIGGPTLNGGAALNLYGSTHASTPGDATIFTTDGVGGRTGRLTVKGNLADGSGYIQFDERARYTPQAVTVADNATPATPATATLTVQSSHIQVTCNDADGCDITMSETGAGNGDFATIVNVSANTVNFADTGGVSELAGALAMGQYDRLTLDYVSDRWVERSRSDN